jgi:hypothetical protein
MVTDKKPVALFFLLCLLATLFWTAASGTEKFGVSPCSTVRGTGKTPGLKAGSDGIDRAGCKCGGVNPCCHNPGPPLSKKSDVDALSHTAKRLPDSSDILSQTHLFKNPLSQKTNDPGPVALGGDVSSLPIYLLNNAFLM